MGEREIKLKLDSTRRDRSVREGEATGTRFRVGKSDLSVNIYNWLPWFGLSEDAFYLPRVCLQTPEPMPETAECPHKTTMCGCSGETGSPRSPFLLGSAGGSVVASCCSDSP